MTMPALDARRPRNERLVDWWSATHVVWGIVLSLVVGPFAALVLLTLWEPFEVFVLSRIAARKGLDFGHESLRNSLMDLVFNTIGVLVAVFGLLPFVDGVPWWDYRFP